MTEKPREPRLTDVEWKILEATPRLVAAVRGLQEMFRAWHGYESVVATLAETTDLLDALDTERRERVELDALRRRSTSLERLCEARQDEIDTLGAKLQELGDYIRQLERAVNSAGIAIGPVVPERKAW